MEFQNLQSLLNRATAPASEEEAKHYCTRFITLVNQEPDGASRAITLLIGKVQSQNEPVALRAIHVMDQCSKFCGKPFQTQVGKFRFLNELIKLVSPKYAGHQTPVAVRSAIVQQLKLWASAFKDQPKILEAYKMLEKTGNTKFETAKTEFAYAAGEDADKAALLASLLKSKNKQDLETANKMIKDMVAAEGRRAERDCDMLKEVTMIQNNGRLLAEMLSNTDRSSEEQLLLNELHKTCVDLRPKLYRLAGQLSDSAQLSSVVEAGETLNKAIEQYEAMPGVTPRAGVGPPPQLTGYQPPSISQPQTTEPSPADRESTTLINLLDDSSGTPQSDQLSADDFDDFLSAVTAGSSGNAPIATPNLTTTNLVNTSVNNGSPTPVSSGLFGGMTLQQPVTDAPQQPPAAQPNSDFADSFGLLSFGDNQPAPVPGPAAAPAAPPTGNTALLLEDIFSGPSQPSLFASGPPGALLQPIVPASAAASEEVKVEEEPAKDTFDMLLPGLSGASFNAPPKSKPTLSQLSAQKSASPGLSLDSLIDVAAPASIPVVPAAPAPVVPAAPVVPVDPLIDVEVPLTLVKPTTSPPILVFDSGVVRVNLYSTDNKPKSGTSVWLATITNSSTATIENVAFGVSKIGSGFFKLSAHTSTVLSPFSPICPSSPIQQVLILTNDITTLNYSLKYGDQQRSGTISLK